MKARFDLRDKSEALNKLIELVGEEFAPRDATDEYVKRIIELDRAHTRKYGKRKMSLKELDRL